MLAHCSAWPDAPFTWLSRAAMTTTQCVRGSSRPVRWALLAPRVALGDGERAQGQRGGGHVPAGHGDEAGIADLAPEELGKAVDGLPEQVGMLVLLAVPLRVERRVLQPEVGREVHDPGHLAEDLRHHR